MPRYGQARLRFIISGLIVPVDRDCDFRWALTTFGIKVLCLTRPNAHCSSYSLTVPDAGSLSNFIACQLGPRVLDRDVDVFLETHVCEVAPITDSAPITAPASRRPVRTRRRAPAPPRR